MGFRHNADFNDGEQEGFGLYQVTQKDGQRHSSAAGYLRPALTRSNFTALAHAQATKLNFEGIRCVGVTYRHADEEKTARANIEVVVCGGAINSPQLLLLSGIGPAAHLADMGVDLIHNLPGVGHNLMDHMQVPLAYHCKEPVSLVGKDSAEQVKRYETSRMGLLTSNLGEAGGFLRVNAESSAPELQYHFGPDWFIRHGFEAPAGHGFTILAGMVSTKSVGRLRLQSPDPMAPPLIDFACLSHYEDVQVLLAGIKLGREIASATAFRSLPRRRVLAGR